MEKMIIITPHLSTGGCPQFILKKIELLKEYYDIYCIEYACHSLLYTIQRNKIKILLNNRFYSLSENGNNLIKIINNINPDIIWNEDFCETFMKEDEMKFIYNNKRTWKILESTHEANDLTIRKKYFPDKFIVVSKHSEILYEKLNIPCSVIEYPIDKLQKNTEKYKMELKFDNDYHHIVNVGLFTPNKNQGYLFNLARKLLKYNIKFHFIGNYAPNFKNYWEPLFKNLPENCIIHGEKDNVDSFLQAGDLFVFPSKKELNPLVIKEALNYDLPILMFNLEIYHNSYKDKNISFLTGNLDADCFKIINTLNINKFLK